MLLWLCVASANSIQSSQLTKEVHDLEQQISSDNQLLGLFGRKEGEVSKLSAKTLVVKTGDRVALMLVGHLRGFVQYGDWKTTAKHVIEPLQKEAFKVDTFVCTAAQVDYHFKTAGIKGQDSLEDEVNISSYIPKAAHQKLNIVFVNQEEVEFPYARRIARCFSHVKAYETESNFQFSYIIRGRPDHIWHGDLSLRPLPVGAVSSRARALVSHPPRNLSLDAMSVPSCGGAFDVESSSGQNIIAAAQREIVASGVGACRILDDQFAVIPRKLSEAFVAAAMFWPAAAASSSASASADREPLLADSNYSAAVPIAGWDASPRIAHTTCQRVMKLFGLGGSMPESVLTDGMLLHAVPVNVAPFQFRIGVNGQPKEALQYDPGVPPFFVTC
jgi:hypothetical protein